MFQYSTAMLFLTWTDKIKMAVLSGDQIVKYLAENLKPEKVVLGSDVDGIYNKDPKKYPDASPY